MMKVFAAVLLYGVASAARAQALPSQPALAQMVAMSGTDPESVLSEPGGSSSASGVRSDGAELPDAPGNGQGQANATAASTQAAGEPQQTKRILGIVPNFRSVSAGVTLPPQTVHEKLMTGFSDSFDYSAVIFAGIQAGISQATKSYPEFHQGAAGYGRYFWHQFADQADENLQVESLLPIVLHEDSRYYTLGHGGFAKRSVYSLSRILITRTDGGTETANVAEVLGAGGAAAVSAAYYPGQYRTWTKVGQRWLTNVILDGATLYVKEFWPDINNKFSKGGS